MLVTVALQPTKDTHSAEARQVAIHLTALTSVHMVLQTVVAVALAIADVTRAVLTDTTQHRVHHSL